MSKLKPKVKAEYQKDGVPRIEIDGSEREISGLMLALIDKAGETYGEQLIGEIYRGMMCRATLNERLLLGGNFMGQA